MNGACSTSGDFSSGRRLLLGRLGRDLDRSPGGAELHRRRRERDHRSHRGGVGENARVGDDETRPREGEPGRNLDALAEVDVVAAGGAQAERVPGRSDRRRPDWLEHEAGLERSVRAGDHDRAADVVGVRGARHVGPASASRDIGAVDELGGHASGAAGRDRLSRGEVVPDEAVVGGDGDPGVLDGALGDDPTSGGVSVRDGEGGVEPLPGCASGSAELRRDEDVEQPLGQHSLEGVHVEAGSCVGGGGAGVDHVEQLRGREGSGAGRHAGRDAGTGEVGGQLHASSVGPPSMAGWADAVPARVDLSD